VPWDESLPGFRDLFGDGTRASGGQGSPWPPLAVTCPPRAVLASAPRRSSSPSHGAVKLDRAIPLGDPPLWLAPCRLDLVLRRKRRFLPSPAAISAWVATWLSSSADRAPGAPPARWHISGCPLVVHDTCLGGAGRRAVRGGPHVPSGVDPVNRSCATGRWALVSGLVPPLAAARTWWLFPPPPWSRRRGWAGSLLPSVGRGAALNPTFRLCLASKPNGWFVPTDATGVRRIAGSRTGLAIVTGARTGHGIESRRGLAIRWPRRSHRSVCVPMSMSIPATSCAVADSRGPGLPHGGPQFLRN